MAKKKQAASISYIDAKGRILYVYKSFVYEVEVYVASPRSYNLQDTVNVALKEYRQEKDYHFKKDGVTIIQNFTLLAAPKSWLEENKFFER